MIYYSELKYNRRFGEINISRPENGYGVYFYPPIEYEEKEAIYKFKKFKIYINKEGYLATSTKDKKISEECFNSIFLSTSLLVYPVLKVNEGEFEKLRKTGSGSYLTPRTLLGAPKIGGQIRKGLFNKKIIISKNEFKIIRHLAELVYNSK